MKFLNPDYLIHLGDITENGETNEYKNAKENFSYLINCTNLEKIWCTGGGAHDGLAGYKLLENYFSFLPILKHLIEKFKTNKILFNMYKWVEYFTQFLRVKFKLGFYQILNHTSQWYTLKCGNNVFVVVGYFNQPYTWSSGEYGGVSEGNLLNQNKVGWLNKTLAKWNGTGNNIFICHHLPLHKTNIYTKKWAGMSDSRFIFESNKIKGILRNYTDVIAWFSGHVHVDSNATYSSDCFVSKGTAVSGKSRPDLPDHVSFICCGDIWKEHGMGWDDTKTSSFSNFRYFDLIKNQSYVDIYAWDSTNYKKATISVNDSNEEVDYFRIKLPYSIKNITDPIEFEQAWDVYDYSKLKYPWYKDSEGLKISEDGWIESRWDFWTKKNFNNVKFEVDTSNFKALTNKFYYSSNGMKSWSKNWYTPENLTEMPNVRWLKLKTDIKCETELYIRDIIFDFLKEYK